MRLRNVRLGDEPIYERMRCDPAMMSELGGPLPRDHVPGKVQRDVASVEAGEAWICMILPDDEGDSIVAGSVVLWSHEVDQQTISEIGWMVLPEFQGRGIGKEATRMLLLRAKHEQRWDMVHAFPGKTNAPSNGICRSLGFALIGQRDGEFAGQLLHTNHWVIDPAVLPG